MGSIGDTPSLGDNISLGRQREYAIEVAVEERKGTFVFRRPSLSDRLKIGVYESTLLGGRPRESMDQATLNIARMMATFTHVMLRWPDWFNLNTEDDYEFLENLYGRYFEEVNPFRRVRSGSEGDKEGSPNGLGAGEVGDSTTV